MLHEKNFLFCHKIWITQTFLLGNFHNSDQHYNFGQNYNLYITYITRLYNSYICYITCYLCYITLCYITRHISKYPLHIGVEHTNTRNLMRTNINLSQLLTVYHLKEKNYII